MQYYADARDTALGTLLRTYPPAPWTLDSELGLPSSKFAFALVPPSPVPHPFLPPPPLPRRVISIILILVLAILRLLLIELILHTKDYSTSPRNRNHVNRNHDEICLRSSQKM